MIFGVQIGVHTTSQQGFPDYHSRRSPSTASQRRDVVAIGGDRTRFSYGYSAEDDELESLRKHIAGVRASTGLPLNTPHESEADDAHG